jgi:hypothetical protein
MAPFLNVMKTQYLRLDFRRDGHVLSLGLIAGATGAGTRSGPAGSSDIRTSGSATTRGRDLGTAWHCHTVTP